MERLKVLALTKLIFRPHSIMEPIQHLRQFYEKYDYDYKIVGMTAFVPVELYSSLGYTLKGKWYQKPENNKLIILVHGYSGIAREMELIMPYFWAKGFDVVTYGIYAYGQKKALVTFGVHESLDLVKLYNGIIQHKKYETIGLYGHSLGANTVLRAAMEVKQTPDFVIANAPFNRLDETLASHLSHWQKQRSDDKTRLQLAREIIKMAKRTWGEKLFPTEMMTITAKLTMPVLYLHGGKDKMNPPYMSEQLASCTPVAQRVILEQANHLNTFIVTKEEIITAITNFLNAKNL
ncbi:MAG: alpha/beta hydrolase [Culicoidibacterales bacterium]